MAEELDFLFRETRNAFGLSLQPSDVRSVWVGLRPLVGAAGQGDAAQSTSQMSREHLIRREAPGLVTVTGGKWTTYRSMAEEVLSMLQANGDVPPAPNGPVDTRQHRLVGAPEEGGSALHPLSDAPGLHLWGSQAEQVLAMIRLDRRRDVQAVNLTYAEQRALEIGITIAGGAQVILLDEPTAGMSRAETTRFVELIREVTVGRTLLTVEHDMGVVFGLADRIAVLVYGEVIAFDTPDKVRADPRGQEAYLGSVLAAHEAEGADRATQPDQEH
jgi:hypothetical protein